jgi:anti-sigma B factor antagonist
MAETTRDIKSAGPSAWPGDPIGLRRHTPAAGQVVVEVSGEVDMLTSPQLRATVLDQLVPEAGTRLLVLDLSGVEFLGTSGLAVLIQVREAVTDARSTLALVCTSRTVLRPLTAAGLTPLFTIHDTLEDALATQPA